MKKIFPIIVLLFFSLSGQLWAQYNPGHSSSSSGLPYSTGLAAALPGSCTAGSSVYYAMNTKTWYFCFDGTYSAQLTKGADGDYAFLISPNTGAYSPAASTYGLTFSASLPRFIVNGALQVPVIYGVAGTGNIATTGTIQGGIVISSDADGMTAAEMTAAGLYGTMFIATGAGTWILPDPAGGENLCLMSSGAAANLILDVTAGATIRLKGTEQADGVGITQAAAKAAGDMVCVVAVAAHKWSTAGMIGTWVSQ